MCGNPMNAQEGGWWWEGRGADEVCPGGIPEFERLPSTGLRAGVITAFWGSSTAPAPPRVEPASPSACVPASLCVSPVNKYSLFIHLFFKYLIYLFEREREREREREGEIGCPINTV